MTNTRTVIEIKIRKYNLNNGKQFCVHAHARVCVYVCVCEYACACASVRMHVRVRVCLCMYVCVCTYACTCACVHVCGWYIRTHVRTHVMALQMPLSLSRDPPFTRGPAALPPWPGRSREPCVGRGVRKDWLRSGRLSAGLRESAVSKA